MLHVMTNVLWNPRPGWLFADISKYSTDKHYFYAGSLEIKSRMHGKDGSVLQMLSQWIL